MQQPLIQALVSNAHYISSENPAIILHDEATYFGSGIKNYQGIIRPKVDPLAIYIPIGSDPVICSILLVCPVKLYWEFTKSESIGTLVACIVKFVPLQQLISLVNSTQYILMKIGSVKSLEVGFWTPLIVNYIKSPWLYPAVKAFSIITYVPN